MSSYNARGKENIPPVRGWKILLGVFLLGRGRSLSINRPGLIQAKTEVFHHGFGGSQIKKKKLIEM